MNACLRVTAQATFAVILCVAISAQTVSAQTAVPHEATLPDSQQLKLDEPLHAAMVRGISRFAEREIARVKNRRTATWLDQPANSSGGSQARSEARKRLTQIIGLPADISELPLIWRNNSSSAPAATSSLITVESVQWNAFQGATGTGLLASPVDDDAIDRAPLVVVIPDADQTPEQLFGLQPGLPESEQLPKRLAESGCIVLCPLLIDRACTWSGHPDIRWTNMPHREFVYRPSFELGLHPVGYEVAKVLTGIQALQTQFSSRKTIVIGTGEGGLIGMCAAAIDTDLVDGVVIRGYFDERENVWKEPIYRNLFGQLLEFGDAEIASLIAPRPLIIENAGTVEVSGPPEKEGRSRVAAPGEIKLPDLATVEREFKKAQAYYAREGAPQGVTLVKAGEKNVLQQVLDLINNSNKSGAALQLQTAAAYDESHPGDKDYLEQRLKTQVDELIRYTQRVLASCDKVRAKAWKKVNMSSPNEFAKSAEAYREWVHETFIGKLEKSTAPFNVRSRKVIDEPTHVGYEVVLDVYPPENLPSENDGLQDWGVIAGGILLLPKDLQTGEKRPVVVCQHGLEGTPMDTISTDQSQRSWRAYKGYSTQLVKRGFIVYAPQNPYKGFDDFRVLQRKSNPLARSLFSYIIEQHRQTLKWLASLPYVDADRIGFYGISYGGKTAVRVPPMLPPTADEPGYALSICSADFNEWIRKNASCEDRYSYVFTWEYEIYEWNMGHIANYAELTSLMVPRPFMVERGHDDGVAPDEWVAWEYAKVQRLYDKLDIGSQTEIEVFNGPHAIHGVGTFRFLRTHLDWPEQKN